MNAHFSLFRDAVLDLIALRRARLDSLSQRDDRLAVEIRDLELALIELIDHTKERDKDEIGEFYREALTVFRSNEELFVQYADVAGLLLALQIEGARRRTMGTLRLVAPSVPYRSQCQASS